MKHIKVINNQIEGEAFILGGTYTTDTGETIIGVEFLTDSEKRALGFYPVIETIPPHDTRYQFLNRHYTVNGDIVELTYTVENNTSIYPQLVEQRLIDFAQQKNIDIQEIEMLLTCGVAQWEQEVATLKQLYIATWQTFYSATSTDWVEIEATLPILSWN